MYTRTLNLTQANKSFFLWGQRQTGKSSLLNKQFKEATYIDLLDSAEYLDYSSNPSLFAERLSELKTGAWVIVDEVQRVPMLLNEIHKLIESKKILFGLCGSSARKLKRGQANLLGGRALRYELLGLSANELGKDFNLLKMLNRGYLPSHYIDDNYYLSMRSYVGDYLKEEIFSEGLVRNLPVFSRFLEVSAIGDTEVVNHSNIGRETGVSSKTVQSYYEMLCDTLVGQYLPAYIKKPKRRIIQSSKFYFHDVGVVNFLAHRKDLQPKTSLFGKAFENWIFHELQCFIKYSLSDYPHSFWQLTSGVEVDFILGDMQIAIEAKSSEKVNDNHLKNLRELKKDHPKIKERIIVSLDKTVRVTEDGIIILPYKEFVKRLWDNPLKPHVNLSFK